MTACIAYTVLKVLLEQERGMQHQGNPAPVKKDNYTEVKRTIHHAEYNLWVSVFTGCMEYMPAISCTTYADSHSPANHCLVLHEQRIRVNDGGGMSKEGEGTIQ